MLSFQLTCFSLSLLPSPPLSVCVSLPKVQLSPLSQVPPLWCCPTPLLPVLFAEVPNSALPFSGCTHLRSGRLSSGTRDTRDGSKGWLWVLGVLSWVECLTCPISAASQSTGADSSWKTRGAKAQPCSLPGRSSCWRRKCSGMQCSHRQVNTHLDISR